jgi:small conductance mechanosensitive channel
MITEDGLQLVFRILLVSAIVVAAYQVAKVVQKLVNRALVSAKLKISSLLHQMFVASARNLILIVGFMIAISQLGISLGPLLAGLGIAGFIVGFALQDTLGNFASGLLILFYRPFDVGDFVNAGGVEGMANHMSLVNTTFMTLDNQRLVVPNNQIWGSVIRNVTAQTTRRIGLVFGISYDDDIEKAERIFAEILDSQPQILDDPEPMIRPHELGDSSVNFVVRPWVATEDYWETYWEITKQVKLRFDQEGVSIPYPQHDIHMIAGA